jgi:hypothetical protein
VIVPTSGRSVSAIVCPGCGYKINFWEYLRNVDPFTIKTIRVKCPGCQRVVESQSSRTIVTFGSFAVVAALSVTVFQILERFYGSLESTLTNIFVLLIMGTLPYRLIWSILTNHCEFSIEKQ